MSSTRPAQVVSHGFFATFGRRHKELKLAVPAIAVIAAVLYVPVLWMVWMSFRDNAGLTLAHYGQIADPNNIAYLMDTFRIATIVTLLSLLIGFPAAYGMYLMPPRLEKICMLLVLMPFFTSILVRTYSWMLLLQRRGLVNNLLIDSGVISQPLRLMYNETGTIIGMLHVLLPLALLPMMASLRALDRNLVAAAATLGASPACVFRTVTLPLVGPGIAAAAVTVFVLALGFYVTPAVLGGGRVVTWAMLVETVLLYNPQWGAASALGIELLLSTLAILWIGRLLFGPKAFQRSEGI
jgi:ABC-type spermidine/putrescine transport system permease subunit I